MTQRTSPKGVDFLVREEGLVPYAYNDPAGHATFGVGHLIHLGRVTSRDIAKYGSVRRPLSRAYALRVFRNDLKKYEAAVRKAVGRRVDQQQFDAMVSLCFNIGTGGFAGSTVARRSRERRPKLAADAFRMWIRPSILKPRRERERRLFLTGRYR